MTMIPDKQGRMIDIHDCSGSFIVSAFDRDTIYQEFLAAFPDSNERKGILREYKEEAVRARALKWFEMKAHKMSGTITAKRIHDFVCEAVATEAGVLQRSERWDWWVGCSLVQPKK